MAVVAKRPKEAPAANGSKSAAKSPTLDLLSPREKKANHIQSEQKRRQAIRAGFEQLCDLVPSLEASQSKSEALVLKKVAEHIIALNHGNVELEKEIAILGGEVPEEEEEEEEAVDNLKLLDAANEEKRNKG
jgi:hypothetical protein